MILRAFIITLGLLLASPALTPALAAVEGEQIGTVIETEGAVSLTGEDGVTHPASFEEPIRMNDVIVTGKGAKAFVQLVDGTEFTLSENARLTVDQYVYNPDDETENKAVYSVLKGAFLYTSGLLAKNEDPDVQVNTPVGSIGIRGTQFWGGPIDASYGVLVNEGEVSVKSAVAKVILQKGQGTSLRGTHYRPSDAKLWASDKVQRAMAAITLKHPELVAERIAARKELNAELLQTRKARLLDRKREGIKNRMERKWQRPE